MKHMLKHFLPALMAVVTVVTSVAPFSVYAEETRIAVSQELYDGMKVGSFDEADLQSVIEGSGQNYSVWLKTVFKPLSKLSKPKLKDKVDIYFYVPVVEESVVEEPVVEEPVVEEPIEFTWSGWMCNSLPGNIPETHYRVCDQDNSIIDDIDTKASGVDLDMYKHHYIPYGDSGLLICQECNQITCPGHQWTDWEHDVKDLETPGHTHSRHCRICSETAGQKVNCNFVHCVCTDCGYDATEELMNNWNTYHESKEKNSNDYGMWLTTLSEQYGFKVPTQEECDDIVGVAYYAYLDEHGTVKGFNSAEEYKKAHFADILSFINGDVQNPDPEIKGSRDLMYYYLGENYEVTPDLMPSEEFKVVKYLEYKRIKLEEK